MRLVVLAGAAIAAWLVLRRLGGDRRRVVVAWADGSELELGSGSPERDRLLAIAEGALG